MENFDYSHFLDDDIDIQEIISLLDGSNVSNAMNNQNTSFVQSEETGQLRQNNALDDIDVSRFPKVPSEEIEELKRSAINKNTSRSTSYWMNVFKSWCSSRRFTNVNIQTMATQELDQLLGKFYAEVKKKDGTDYEPDSLRIMQCAIDRYLKENGYIFSISRAREFRDSQEVLNAKALDLRRQGKGKRPNKAQPLAPEEESSLWDKGQLGHHDGRALTNVNFKHLTEHFGLRGRQEHYDSYVEDFTIRPQQNGGEVIEYRENPTKTRSGGLRIQRRTTPQLMYSTDGGEKDPVRLFKLWLSKRPEGMKDSGPLYLSVIPRPKSTDVWYSRVRMGENTIGNIMKNMATCLNTTKKLTNHSMRKTLVSKLKTSGQARNVIREITGHSRESSLDDYDEIGEDQRKDLSHIISGYQDPAKENINPRHQPTSSPQINTAAVSNVASPPCQQAGSQVPTQAFDPSFQCNPLPFQSPSCAPVYPYPTYFNPWLSNNNSSSVIPNVTPTYTGCTINNYYGMPQKSPSPKKKRRAFIIDSDSDDEQ